MEWAFMVSVSWRAGKALTMDLGGDGYLLVRHIRRCFGNVGICCL